MTILSTLYALILAHPTFPLAGAILILLLYTAYLHHKIHKLTRGKTGSSLEEIMQACVDGVAQIEKRNELISKHALLLDEKIAHSVRNVETVRYKAFEQNGSNQSFSVALVNEKGNGVVLSTLHAHERVSTFAKPISQYESTYELTDEEQQVLREAKSKHRSTAKIETEE